jgi:hypothetical protein
MKQNPPFGSDRGPDNVPMATNGMQRPTVNADRGKQITRQVKNPAPANPYAGFTGNSDLDALLGG